jgi:hypothetical protein
MNSTLSKFARQQLKQNLAQCTPAQQLIFKRMYAHKNLELPVEDVVDIMTDEQLDWAMQQVERTVAKNQIRDNGTAA